MTSKALFHIAYGAARIAAPLNGTGYRSPLAAGLDATTDFREHPARFNIVAAAARAAEMHASYRARVASRVMLRPQTSMKLANRRLLATLGDK